MRRGREGRKSEEGEGRREGRVRRGEGRRKE